MALRADGWEVAEVAGPDAGTRPAALRGAGDALAEMVAAVPADRDTVLVPHSNAGLFTAGIAARRPRVSGYVFVDAGLPLPPPDGPDGPDSTVLDGTVPMIPRPFYEMLAAKAADDGMVPPWTQWWDEDISGLFPDNAVRAGIEREQRRLPLSYFREAVPVPPGWLERGAAYLAFGDTYAGERDTAGRFGWPVRTLPGEHLHMLMAPGDVASAIGELARALTASR